jgi:hypothetical protein
LSPRRGLRRLTVGRSFSACPCSVLACPYARMEQVIRLALHLQPICLNVNSRAGVHILPLRMLPISCHCSKTIRVSVSFQSSITASHQTVYAGCHSEDHGESHDRGTCPQRSCPTKFSSRAGLKKHGEKKQIGGHTSQCLQAAIS